MSPVRISRSCLESYAVAIFMLSLITFSSRAMAEEDITGKWELRMSFGGRDSFATLSIAKKSDGQLTGMWGRTELSKVKFDGGKLTFVRTLRFGDNEFSLDYEGRLKDGKLDGTKSYRSPWDVTAEI